MTENEQVVGGILRMTFKDALLYTIPSTLWVLGPMNILSLLWLCYIIQPNGGYLSEIHLFPQCLLKEDTFISWMNGKRSHIGVIQHKGYFLLLQLKTAHDKKFNWPPRSESSPLPESAKKWSPWSYNYQEQNSANNLHEFRSWFFPTAVR